MCLISYTGDPWCSSTPLHICVEEIGSDERQTASHLFSHSVSLDPLLLPLMLCSPSKKAQSIINCHLSVIDFCSGSTKAATIVDEQCHPFALF